jgi:hypothetical protein
MTNHTPGPWAFIESNDARTPDRITSATGSPVASGSIGINRHDSRLIAAAPDLLAALLDALPYVEDILNDPAQLACFKPGIVQGHAKAIRAAIAKATT